MYQMENVNEILRHQAAVQAVRPGEPELDPNEQEAPQGLFSHLPPPTD
ncbi:MAG: hypothetical protein AAF495_06395 [Pseudomonadota bacterium]